NEFHAGRRMLLVNGGTWAIESPVPYSSIARGLMDHLGIQPAKLAAKCYATDTYKGLRRAVFFNKETFGTDKLVLVSPAETGGGNELTIAKFVGEFPLPEAVRRDVLRLETAAEDFLPGLNSAEKKDRLTRMSYKKFVLDVVKADPRIVPVYQARTHGL